MESCALGLPTPYNKPLVCARNSKVRIAMFSHMQLACRAAVQNTQNRFLWLYGWPRHRRQFCGNATACLSLAPLMNLHEKHLFACYADNYSEKGNTIGSALQGCQNWGITYVLPWRCFWRGPGGTVEMDAQDESCLPRGLGPHPANQQQPMW